MKIVDFVFKIIVRKFFKNNFSMHLNCRKRIIVIDTISYNEFLNSMIIFQNKQIQKI